MTVSRELNIELKVSKGLLEFLQGEGVQILVDQIYDAVAKHVVGQNEGEDPRSSVIGRHFTKSNKDRYGFAPLSPKYAAWKRKKVGNKPILILTGAWKKAALMVKVRKRKKGVTVTPKKPPHYAKYLEHGTPKMPARPAFTANREDRREISRFVQAFVDDKFGKMARAWVSDHVSVIT